MTIIGTIQTLATEAFGHVATLVAATCQPGEPGCFTDPQTVRDAIQDSGAAFKVASFVFRIVGVGVVVFTVWSVVKSLIKAQVGPALRSGVSGLVAAVLCFNIALPLELIEGVGVLFSRVFDSVNDVLKKGGGG